MVFGYCLFNPTRKFWVFQIALKGGMEWEIVLRVGIFYQMVGIWQGVILTIQTCFKSKK